MRFRNNELINEFTFLEVLLIIDWSGSAFSVYTDTETWSKLGKENALLILNHSNELDLLVAWVLGNQANILGISIFFFKSVASPYKKWSIDRCDRYNI
jgi:1-acyl-sn-glycerol-3-phosphate acyltransferase